MGVSLVQSFGVRQVNKSGPPNHLLHLTAIKFLISLLFIVAVAAGEQWRSAAEGLLVENGWSPEMETLDQLCGGHMLLSVIRQVYPDAARFECGLSGLLLSGDVRLMWKDGTELPQWRWRELVADASSWHVLQVGLTPAGARRIGL